MSEKVKATWKIVRSQERTNPSVFDDFVQSVISHDAKEKVVKKRMISDVTEEADEKEWIPWHLAETREGHDVLLEQVKSKTVESRRHTKLPADSSIPWPQNLQIRYIREWEKKSRSTTEDTESKVEDQSEEAGNDFDTMWQGRKLNMVPESRATWNTSSQQGASLHSGGGSSVSNSLPEGMAPMLAPPSADEIRDRAVVQHIRKAHNAWDRSRREFSSTILRSSECVNTKGCKFEADLNTIIAEGNMADDDLVKLEQKFLSGDRYQASEVEKAAGLTKDIKELIKKANKIVAAMKPWFGL